MFLKIKHFNNYLHETKTILHENLSSFLPANNWQNSKILLNKKTEG